MINYPKMWGSIKKKYIKSGVSGLDLVLTIRSKPNGRGHMLSALVMDLVIDLCAGNLIS